MVQGFPTQFLIGRSSHKILKKCFTLKKIYVHYVYSSFINQLNPKVTNSSTKTTENLINNKGVENLNGDQAWAVILCVMFPSCLKNSLWLFARVITGVFWEHALCTLLLRSHCFGLPNTERTRKDFTTVMTLLWFVYISKFTKVINTFHFIYFFVYNNWILNLK